MAEVYHNHSALRFFHGVFHTGSLCITDPLAHLLQD
ncbi:Uncharacterised protein [Leminorella richardii]|uniref:Uncharacterized protein n=1 Tax=Leminorella richardii TaxID=158841 RepID=A0A2X4UWS4_9GAMM|nr:Uncharacterised protein [Leminorella richardii]